MTGSSSGRSRRTPPAWAGVHRAVQSRQQGWGWSCQGLGDPRHVEGAAEQGCCPLPVCQGLCSHAQGAEQHWQHRAGAPGGGVLLLFPVHSEYPHGQTLSMAGKGPDWAILCPWMSPVLLPVLVVSSHMPGAHLHRVLPGTQDFHQRPSPESLHSPNSLPSSLQGSAKLFGASSGKMQGQTGQAATLPLPSRKEGARARAMQCRGSRMSSTPSCPSVFLTVPLPHWPEPLQHSQGAAKS